jgi:hypothetical protein
MFKFLLLISFTLSTLVAHASPLESTMSMKERIRLSLWYEGIENKDKTKESTPKKQHPEEIERALRKM